MTTIYNVAFAHGATRAFLVGVFMILIGSAIVWLFLDVKHEEINDVQVPEGAAAI